jgi:hypothetical protein
MPRKMTRRDPEPSGPDGTEPSEQGERNQDQPAIGRRRLLTGGGVVMAGAVGAGVATAVASPASAQAMTPVDMNTANNAGTNLAQPTELDAANNTAPAFILKNTGIDTSTTPNGAGPNLRLTPSAETVPTASTAGGDLTTTTGGLLWFTHNFGGSPPAVFAAPVHTDATAISSVPLLAPRRMLDTRTSRGRANVLDPSGKFDSTGRLLAGKTIHINLTSLVSFGDGVTSNLTVTKPASAGFLVLWSGAVARPTASSINFVAGQTIANLTVSGLAEFSTTATDTIAIFASATTHVILDVGAFAVRDLGQVLVPFASPAASARAQRARQALAKLQA